MKRNKNAVVRGEKKLSVTDLMLLLCMRNQYRSVDILQKQTKQIFCLKGSDSFLETTFIEFYFSFRLDPVLKESPRPHFVSIECILFE